MPDDFPTYDSCHRSAPELSPRERRIARLRLELYRIYGPSLAQIEQSQVGGLTLTEASAGQVEDLGRTCGEKPHQLRNSDDLAVDQTIDGQPDCGLQSDDPEGRIGEVEDIALMALYLASPAASWVTGKIFEVDGGTEASNWPFEFPPL